MVHTCIVYGVVCRIRHLALWDQGVYSCACVAVADNSILVNNRTTDDTVRIKLRLGEFTQNAAGKVHGKEMWQRTNRIDMHPSNL